MSKYVVSHLQTGQKEIFLCQPHDISCTFVALYWAFLEKKIPDTIGEQCNIIIELGKCPIYAYWTILYDIWNTKFFSESPNNLLSNEILPDIKYIFTKGSLQDIVNFHGAIFILCQLYKGQF